MRRVKKFCNKSSLTVAHKMGIDSSKIIYIYRSKNSFYTCILSTEYILGTTLVIGDTEVERIEIHVFVYMFLFLCSLKGRTNNVHINNEQINSIL